MPLVLLQYYSNTNNLLRSKEEYCNTNNTNIVYDFYSTVVVLVVIRNTVSYTITISKYALAGRSGTTACITTVNR